MKIDIRRTYISIPNYNLGDNEFLENGLSVWDKVYYSWNNIGFTWNEETKELRIPRGYSVNTLSGIFKDLPLDFDYTSDPCFDSIYTLKTMPKSDIQRKSISFLLGEQGFEYTKKFSQLTLNLDTGDGKTYCVIAALTFIRNVSMIIIHNNHIKEQWIESFTKFTSLSSNHILNIDGTKTINKINNLLETKKKLPFKVYVVTHATLRNYAKKNSWEDVHKLMCDLGIGVKVFDEAHLEFENILNIDLNTNTKKSIYLTANFERIGIKESVLFKTCFGHIAQYGIETKKEKRKHIKYLGMLFNSNPSITEEASAQNIHGFDKNKYCDYEIENEKFIDTVKFALSMTFNLEGKTLILLSKIKANEIIKEYIDEMLKEEGITKTVALYNSTISDEDKVKALDSDIIISTQKSLGTGNDIPGLRTVIMTEAYSSKIIANQTSGRLREYDKDKYTFYIEIVDIGFKKAYRMYKQRNPIFKKKCFSVAEINK